MRKTLFTILISCSLLVGGFCPQVLASGKGERKDASQLFESKCTICHSIDRPKSKKKSKKGWENTVMRMKNKNGCPITDEEAKIIIDYLAEKYGN